MINNGNKHTKTVVDAIILHISKHNLAFKTITFDNGSEFDWDGVPLANVMVEVYEEKVTQSPLFHEVGISGRIDNALLTHLDPQQTWGGDQYYIDTSTPIAMSCQCL